MTAGDLLLAGLGLVLVVEGLLPFFSPASWRRLFERLMKLEDRQLRVLGLSSMVAGVLTLLFFGR